MKITLAEFQHTTGLSDSSILWLVKHNQLEFEYHKDLGLMVESELVETKQLVQSLVSNEQTQLELEKKIIVERLSLIVANHLDRLVEDALE